MFFPFINFLAPEILSASGLSVLSLSSASGLSITHRSTNCFFRLKGMEVAGGRIFVELGEERKKTT
jgi:hypothetical protein